MTLVLEYLKFVKEIILYLQRKVITVLSSRGWDHCSVCMLSIKAQKLTIQAKYNKVPGFGQ